MKRNQNIQGNYRKGFHSNKKPAQGNNESSDHTIFPIARNVIENGLSEDKKQQKLLISNPDHKGSDIVDIGIAEQETTREENY